MLKCDGRISYRKWCASRTAGMADGGSPTGYGSMSSAVAMDDEPHDAGGADDQPTGRGEKRVLSSYWSLNTEYVRMIKMLRKVVKHQD